MNPLPKVSRGTTQRGTRNRPRRHARVSLNRGGPAPLDWRKGLGWPTGLEPVTAGTTNRSSTN